MVIVDDNPANLGVLVELLTRQGLEVSIAEDGESALEQAKDVRPDLILLDVMMPESVENATHPPGLRSSSRV